VPSNELRIVVVAPAAAEMLESLESLDHVVAIADFGPWPEAIAGLPSVGGYDSPNVERILSLEANLLITAASEAGAVAHQRLESLGVRVIALDTSTYEGVFSSLREVGAIIGRSAEAVELARTVRDGMEKIAGKAVGLEPRKVLFVVGRDPYYVAGPGSHIDRLIRQVGGTNVAHDAAASYQRFSVEAILDTSDNRERALRGSLLGSWDRWPFLPAVEMGRVYQVDPSRLVIPGIRFVEMAELMGRLIQPETFGEPTEADFLPRDAP
jgi:iron complex transport system substrate-binding protein